MNIVYYVFLFEYKVTFLVLIYYIFKFCIYKKYGFKKMSTIINDNKLSENEIKRIKFNFYAFWILIYIFILYSYTIWSIYSSNLTGN